MPRDLTAAQEAAINAAALKFQKAMQRLVDKGETGRITIRANNGPEVVVAEKRPK